VYSVRKNFFSTWQLAESDWFIFVRNILNLRMAVTRKSKKLNKNQWWCFYWNHHWKQKIKTRISPSLPINREIQELPFWRMPHVLNFGDATTSPAGYVMHLQNLGYVPLLIILHIWFSHDYFSLVTFSTLRGNIALCSVKTASQNFNWLFAHRFVENFKRYLLIKKVF